MINFREWMAPEIEAQETQDSIEAHYKGPEVKGYIQAKRDQENPNIYRVIRVGVTPAGQGYGKMLYMKILEATTKKDALLAPAKNSTSDSALNVWKSLYLDPKIEKVQLRPNDWPQTSRNNTLMGKYKGLRYSEPETWPPREDQDFWTVNSGYRLKGGA